MSLGGIRVVSVRRIAYDKTVLRTKKADSPDGGIESTECITLECCILRTAEMYHQISLSVFQICDGGIELYVMIHSK